MQTVILNLTFFKLAWLACVASAAAAMPAIGLGAIALAVAWHLARTDNPRGETLLLIIASIGGYAWETTLVASGLLVYDAGTLVEGTAPYWIVAMWALFASTLNVSMRWLRRSAWLAAAAGAIGGPMSFYAGASAGAVVFPEPATALVVIGAGWALMLPALVRLARYVEESTERPAGAAVGA